MSDNPDVTPDLEVDESDLEEPTQYAPEPEGDGPQDSQVTP